MLFRNCAPLRLKGVSLPDAVKKTFFGNRMCPCCKRYITYSWQPRRGKKTPDNLATHAHDFAVAAGGDPRQWFFACNRCNNDQGPLDLVAWSHNLTHCGDPRADNVAKLAAFVRLWVEEATKRKRPRRRSSDGAGVS